MVLLLNILIILIGLTCIVIWVKSLVDWDCDDSCDKTQCSTCPFYCERYIDK